jgi:hypothetical protein
VDDFAPQGRPSGDANTAHEADALGVRTLIAYAAALVAVCIVVQVVLALVVWGFTGEEKAVAALAPPRFAGDAGGFPAPRLQSDPAGEFLKLKDLSLSRLGAYGWVDESAGIAHIPIDRAIEILASSGLPVPVGGAAAVPPAPEAAPAGARPDSGKDQKP